MSAIKFGLKLLGCTGLLLLHALVEFSTVQAQEPLVDRKACEQSTIKALKARRDSGFDIVINDKPIPPISSPIGKDELAARCRSYILRSERYHPRCDCPL